MLMSKIKFVVIILLSGVCLSGCNAHEKKAAPTKEAIINGISLDQRLEATDSMVIVFYKDPYGSDSIRYTRYYTQITTTNTKDIAAMLEQAKLPLQQEEQRDECRNEGKIWCFTDGRVFQTLYFSTRCDKCCHLLLLKDGNFYYGELGSNFTNWLAMIKPQSKDPDSLLVIK